jgi:hypothetical protein
MLGEKTEQEGPSSHRGIVCCSIPKNSLNDNTPSYVQNDFLGMIYTSLKMGEHEYKEGFKVDAYNFIMEFSTDIDLVIGLEKENKYNHDDLIKYAESFYETELKEIDKLIQEIAKQKIEFDKEHEKSPKGDGNCVPFYLYTITWKIGDMYLSLDINAEQPQEILKEQLIVLQNNFHSFLEKQLPEIEKFFNERTS